MNEDSGDNSSSEDQDEDGSYYNESCVGSEDESPENIIIIDQGEDTCSESGIAVETRLEKPGLTSTAATTVSDTETRPILQLPVLTISQVNTYQKQSLIQNR